MEANDFLLFVILKFFENIYAVLPCNFTIHSISFSFIELDKRLEKGTVKLAIERQCKRKTTLSNILKNIYDCTVFHMDDFFCNLNKEHRKGMQRQAET